MTFEEWWKQTNGVGVMRKKDAQFWFHKGAEAQRERDITVLAEECEMSDGWIEMKGKEVADILRSAPIEGEKE